jgi:DNA-binding CsgD family transcriptional regulator
MLSMKKELLGLKDELSEREKEVLTWVARGKTAWEVATILHLSRRTVEWYINQARIRLNAYTVVQAVANAMKQGQIYPSLISNGMGVVSAAAATGYQMLRHWDWIGPPGGLA